jgi:hypothetical protein
MLIRSFDSVSSLQNNELSDCGILKYKRSIYLFVDPNIHQNNMTKIAKAVIINSSVNKGSKDGNIIHIAVDNSVMIRFSVYFCNVIFETPNNIELSQFNIESAYSREIQSLFTQRHFTTFMVGFYSSELGQLRNENEDLFWTIINNMDTSVLPPLYYTEMHQYKVAGDIFSLDTLVTEIYSGRELIDNNTSVEYMDISLWDTMKYNFLGVMENIENKKGNTIDVLNDFYHDFINFVGEDCYFIYDSDGKGSNTPGTNIIGKNIPYKPYYIPEYIGRNVNTALNLFEQSCHNIENKYGHIKVQCYPNKIGNKLKINFKDYNQHPKELPPLGNVTPDGNNSSSDNGFHVKRVINETLDYLAFERY